MKNSFELCASTIAHNHLHLLFPHVFHTAIALSNIHHFHVLIMSLKKVYKLLLQVRGNLSMDKDDNDHDDPILSNSDANCSKMSNYLSGVTAFQERIYYIYREYDSVVKNPIEGVYVTVGADSPLVWFGLIIVRAGIFYGGIFRFSITISDDFPDTNLVPVVQFEEPLFHPMICPKDNCVDLGRFFPSGWQRDRNHIYQIITATQGIFFSCQCDSSQAANPEAAILLKENRHKFVQMAHDAVRRSRTQVYAMPSSSEDKNSIRFTPWNEAEMEKYRLFLLGKRTDSEIEKVGTAELPVKAKQGISWVSEKDDWTFLCNHTRFT